MYLNEMGGIQKGIKIPIFPKKKFIFSYHGSFVISKNVKPENEENQFCMSNDCGS